MWGSGAWTPIRLGGRCRICDRYEAIKRFALDSIMLLSVSPYSMVGKLFDVFALIFLLKTRI